jgi:transcriptional regulator with GAF, ATPase, and Fis domain
MDSYSILAPARPDEVERTRPSGEVARSSAPHSSSPSLQTNNNSIHEVAEHDLQASLQLLADRMQYLTGASAATIALSEGQEMLCRASAGHMATELAAPLRADSTLVNQSISKQQIICCNNTRNGTRNDGTSYRDLGIKAIMVMPLIRGSEVMGMLELLADRTDAFDDHDGVTLEHLSEIVLTALEHADAAKGALSKIAHATSTQELELPGRIAATLGKAENVTGFVDSGIEKVLAKIHHCEGCGFPVSEGRMLCLDCEEARTQEGGGTPPTFLSALMREHGQGWLQSHFYTIGAVLMVLLTVIALMLRLR